MRHAFVLAFRHLWHQRMRSAILIAALGLVAFLPIAVRSLISAAGASMRIRAEATPLVVGARGSEFDLVAAAVYFAQPTPRPLGAGDLRRIADAVRGTVVPLHLGYSARGLPLVGTTVEYFERRGLTLASGRPFTILGEAVLGARAAERVAQGGADVPLLTDAIDPYDLSGTLPLRLHPVGTLAPTGTPDDDAIFVDVKTAWVVAGIGHGHVAAETITDPNDLIGRVQPGPPGAGTAEHVVASERLRHFEEITPENMASFHFHGDEDRFPLHAIVVWPADAKASALLQGAFQRRDEPLQIVRPADAIGRLLGEILRVQRFLDAILIAVALATAAVAALVIVLSVRVREDELRTMVRLGAARGTVAMIIAAEVLLLIGGAAALALLGLSITPALAPLVQRAIVG